MPRRVSAEAKRVALNCLVLPETKRFLGQQECSQGEAVDRAVSALRSLPPPGLIAAGALIAVHERAEEVAKRLEYAAWKGFNQSGSEFEKGYKHAMEVAAKIVRQHFAIDVEAPTPKTKG